MVFAFSSPIATLKMLMLCAYKYIFVKTIIIYGKYFNLHCSALELLVEPQFIQNPLRTKPPQTKPPRTIPPQTKPPRTKPPHFFAWVGQTPRPNHGIILDFSFFVTHNVS